MVKFNIKKLICEEENQIYIHAIEKDLKTKEVQFDRTFNTGEERQKKPLQPSQRKHWGNLGIN